MARRSPLVMAVLSGLVAGVMTLGLAEPQTAGASAFTHAFGGRAVDLCTPATLNGCRAGASGGGETMSPRAVDVSGGEAFAVDGQRIVVRDAATGAFKRAFGKGVNAGAGDPDICTTSCRQGTSGSADGQITQSWGVAVDAAADDVFVSDQGNKRVTVFSRAGAFKRNLGAGDLQTPYGAAVSGGELFVTEWAFVDGTGFVGGIAVLDPATGVRKRTIGSAGTGAGQLDTPIGIAVSGDDVFVGDVGNSRVSVFSVAGTFRRAFGRNVNNSGFSFQYQHVCTPATGCKAGEAGTATGQLDGPYGVTVSGEKVFVSEQTSNRVSAFERAGSFAGYFAGTIGKDVNAGSGDPDLCFTTCRQGTQSDAARGMLFPIGLAASGGEVFVAESGNRRITVIDPGVMQAKRALGMRVGYESYNCTLATGCTAGDSDTAAAHLRSPAGLAVAYDLAFVADSGNSRVSVFNAKTGAFSAAWGKDVNAAAGASDPGVCTTACQRGGLSGDGSIGNPYDTAVDQAEVFVSDVYANRVAVFTLNGAFKRNIGAGILAQPRGITVSGGELFVADSDADAIVVLDPATGALKRSFGTFGSGDGQFFVPEDVAVRDGDAYVTDSGNDRVSVHDAASGAFERSFGSYGSGDGQFDNPIGIGFDGGEVLVSDQVNDRVQVFDAAAGTFNRALGTSGAAAGQLENPTKLAVSENEVYVADHGNARISVFRHDTTAPAAPSGLTTDPATAGRTRNAAVKGTAEAGSTVRVYPSADCTGNASTGSATAFGSSGITTAQIAEGSTTRYSATATDAAGNVSSCSSPSAEYTHDPAPAAPTGLGSTPASPSSDTSPEITGTAPAGTTVHLYTTSNCTGPAAATGTAADFAATGFTVTVTSDSSTPFRATASDSLGAGACSAPYTYTHASPPPAAPTGLASNPDSPSADTSPEITGTAPAGTTVALYEGTSCGGGPVAIGTAAAFATPGITVSVPAGQTRTFSALARDGRNVASACSTSTVTYTVPAPVVEQQPPTAFTQSAISITSTSATLRGSVGPDGVTYGFEYGTTNAFGAMTATAVAQPGSGGNKESAISGLAPATTYWFRVFASRTGAATAYGNATSFTTTAANQTQAPQPFVPPMGTAPVAAFQTPPAQTAPVTTTPRPVTAGTATVTPKKVACAGLRGKALATCRARAAYKKAMAACAKKARSKRSACGKAARLKLKRALARAKKLR